MRANSVVLRDASNWGDNAERKIVPEKPPRLVNMMLEVAVVPKGIINESGLAEIAKSVAARGEA